MSNPTNVLSQYLKFSNHDDHGDSILVNKHLNIHYYQRRLAEYMSDNCLCPGAFIDIQDCAELMREHGIDAPESKDYFFWIDGSQKNVNSTSQD